MVKSLNILENPHDRYISNRQDVVKKLEEYGTQSGQTKEPLVINRATIEEKTRN
jgi:hypothetical protein